MNKYNQEAKDLHTKINQTLMKEIKDKTNGKTFHIHESEDLPSYPKPCIDSIQSLSKFQWHFYRYKREFYNSYETTNNPR